VPKRAKETVEIRLSLIRRLGDAGVSVVIFRLPKDLNAASEFETIST
jgi:hypothetical protein